MGEFNHNWRTAFFTQAFSDYKLLIFLARHGMTDDGYRVEECHKLHYLQMTAEKLAKGFMTNGLNPPEFDHTMLARFFRDVLPKHQGLRKFLGFADDASFKHYLNGFEEIVHYIASLAPGGKRQDKNRAPENPEYPWETRAWRNGIAIQMHVPCEHDWEKWQTTEMIKFLEFLDKCIGYAKHEEF